MCIISDNVLFWQHASSSVDDQYVPSMFHEELKALRIRLGLSQQEMADRLSIDRSTYSRLEHKEHPPAYLVERINKMFQVDAWAWIRPDEVAPDGEQGPRLVHLRPEQELAGNAEGNWRLKAVDLLGRITELLAAMIKDPGKRGGGG